MESNLPPPFLMGNECFFLSFFPSLESTEYSDKLLLPIFSVRDMTLFFAPDVSWELRRRRRRRTEEKEENRERPPAEEKREREKEGQRGKGRRVVIYSPYRSYRSCWQSVRKVFAYFSNPCSTAVIKCTTYVRLTLFHKYLDSFFAICTGYFFAEMRSGRIFKSSFHSQTIEHGIEKVMDVFGCTFTAYTHNT